MFIRLETKPGLLAYEITGTITADDVDAVYDDMRKAFEQNDKVSFFAELVGDFDMEAAAFWRDLSRAHEAFGHFSEIERVAFVANRSWITAIARLESAVLSPFDFEMQVFDPAERERAMAWAEGEIDDSNTPSIRQLPSDDPRIAIFEIDGKIRKSDLAVSKEILKKFQDDDQPRNLMGVVKDFAGFELALLADKELFRMKLEAAKHLDRYAFVGAPSWLEGYIETIGGLLKPELRTFDADERDEALAWLKEDALVA